MKKVALAVQVLLFSMWEQPMNPGSAWPVLQRPMMLPSICETFILSLLSSGVVPSDSARNAKSRNSIVRTIAGYVKGNNRIGISSDGFSLIHLPHGHLAAH